MAKTRVRFILKNGIEIPVFCDKLKITVSTLTGKITEYAFSGAEGSYPMYFNIEEIAAIMDDGKVEENE